MRAVIMEMQPKVKSECQAGAGSCSGHLGAVWSWGGNRAHELSPWVSMKMSKE